MKLVAFVAAVLLGATLPPTPSFAGPTGAWRLQARAQGVVDFTLHYHGDRHDENWEHGFPIAGSALGLSTADLRSHGVHRRFNFSPDAGTFACEGWLSDGAGGGSFTFAPNPNFVQELAKRGIGAPSEEQQFRLAFENFSLATLDEMRADGYQMPDVDGLIAMIDHGVTSAYIRRLSLAGYRVGTVHELIRLVDHGVTADYAARLPRLVAKRPSAEDLINGVDHGVTLTFAENMAAAFGRLDLAQDIAMVDHGVSSDFVAGLRRLGYRPTPDQAISLVDHGVSLNYIERLRSHGYTRLSVDDLIRLRDSGV